MPYTDFDQVANCLDSQRLGKQRVEALQILQSIPLGEHSAACEMWRGHEYTLARYGHTMCVAWAIRGFRDNLRPLFAQHLTALPLSPIPNWLNPSTEEAKRLMLTHRSNLVRKDPDYYRRYWPTINPNERYYWPNKPKVKIVCVS